MIGPNFLIKGMVFAHFSRSKSIFDQVLYVYFGVGEGGFVVLLLCYGLFVDGLIKVCLMPNLGRMKNSKNLGTFFMVLGFDACYWIYVRV